MSRIVWRTAYFLLAVLPACFLAWQVATWRRNVPNWDEFDTVLDLLISLDAGVERGEIASQVVSIQNEHRTVVSRSLFVLSYWIFGGINFIALAVVGNLFLVALFVLLLARVRDAPARWRLAAIFSLAVFQLQHHESLFWGGSSIDHFLVVMAAVGGLVALTAQGRWSVPLGALGGFVATFSLAQGLLVWPIAMLLLAWERRTRELLAWTSVGALSTALFLAGFHVNPGHHLPQLSDIPAVLWFWLRLLGSSPAFDDVTLAPWCGGILVVATAWVFRRAGEPRERFAGVAILWCIGAAGLIAWGRTLLSNEWAPITSRYIILSSVAWALLAWVIVERAIAAFPRWKWWLVPFFAGLVYFNLAANFVHFHAGRVYAMNADSAVESFYKHGSFVHAPTPLYPDPARADAMIREAQKREIFRLPEIDSAEAALPAAIPLEAAREIDNVHYFIDEFEEGPGQVRISGWAFRPEEGVRYGDVGVLFRSEGALLAFEAFPRLRPAVAEVFERSDAAYAGFELTVPTDKLPAGTYGMGICFSLHGSPEYIMTANTLVVRAR